MIRYISDNLIRLIAPTNTQPDPNTVISAGTCTARLFDDGRETTLSAVEATAQTVLSVERARSIDVGSTVVIQLADGSYHNGGAVTARDLEADTVTITTALASGAAIGARVMTKIGPSITMAAYGTPALGTTTWGFEGTMEAAHADVLPGMALRIEIDLDAAGVELVNVIRESVVVGY